ncbi:hypothetical protein DFH09DRAFT_1197480 [Mycena vulgaris]|nr:hypothetical protein DFH09DRAFT_1197480 [Mycena vulgaris]
MWLISPSYVNKSRELAEEEKNGSQENREAFELPPHIASAFLIESTDHAQREVETASTERLRVTDFNGRQLYLPLELCKSWPDLCLFLNLFFRGDKQSHFITSRNFGLRVPTEVGLLSSDTWDLWVARFAEDVGKPPVTLDLYAIMNDDSDSCPHCKIHSPVKQPLPNNQQQCLGTPILETVEEPCDELILAGPNAAKLSSSPQNTPRNFDFVSTYSEAELSENVQQSSVSNAHVSSAVQISGTSVPMHVQVIRRRKPVKQDLEDTQSTSTSTDRVTSNAPPHAPQAESHCWKLLHVLYMYVMFGLPDRYYQDVPQSQNLGSNDNRACRTYRVWVDEWSQIGSAAGVLFSVLFTILQISSASYDPVVRTVVQLSIVCLFFGAIYAFILRMRFRKLGNEPEGHGWIRATSRAARNPFWNPWIMLSMPLAWIIWGVLYFACFILAFLWRSGATNEADANSRLSPSQEYGPRAITTLLFGVGAVYLLLIIVTVRGIGTARNP